MVSPAKPLPVPAPRTGLCGFRQRVVPSCCKPRRKQACRSHSGITEAPPVTNKPRKVLLQPTQCCPAPRRGSSLCPNDTIRRLQMPGGPAGGPRGSLGKLGRHTKGRTSCTATVGVSKDHAHPTGMSQTLRVTWRKPGLGPRADDKRRCCL